MSNWLFNDEGNVHAQCLGKHLPEEFSICTWLPVDMAADCLPREKVKEMFLAYANRAQQPVIEISQLDLQAMNRGESVTKWLQGVEVLLRP